MHPKNNIPNVTCEHCGTPFRVIPARVGKARYCGYECYWASSHRAPVINGDGTASIPLTQGLMALIDEADLPMVAGRSWYASDQGGRVYARTRDGGKSPIFLHRALMGDASELIDHISRDTLDNRRCNLRAATSSQNNSNQPHYRNNTSGFKGVYRNRERWSASIQADGILRRLGTFDTPEEAARAYDAAAIELHGEFAHLNFPPTDRESQLC